MLTRAKFLIMIVILILTLTIAIVQTSANAGFVFDGLRPYPDSNINAVKTTIMAHVTSDVSIDGVRVLVDGVRYSATFKPRYNYSDVDVSCPISNLKDGTRVVELYVRDSVGNIGLKTWQFGVMVKPTISDLYPTEGSAHQSVSHISAKVLDANDLLQKNNIELLINGSPISDFTYDALKWTPLSRHNFLDFK